MNSLSADLDELLQESLSPADPEPDDLSDLDSLLAESTKLAKANRDRNQGRKLTAEQQEILAANEAAANMRLWEEQAQVAHFITSECTCGHVETRFSAWYKIIHHRTQSSSQLIRCAAVSDLPKFRHVTHEQVSSCMHCVSMGDFDAATISSFPLLAELGKPRS